MSYEALATGVFYKFWFSKFFQYHHIKDQHILVVLIGHTNQPLQFLSFSPLV